MDPKAFGAFVQARRKKLGMNQTQLAEKLHVTAKAVSRWERGVGFPSIELLQPLADALEITIAELMQSKLLEQEIPKEEAARLVSQTMETIQKQEAMNWKRKLILYGGYAVFLLMYLFLNQVGMKIRFESRWTGLLVVEIGFFIWWFGTRALNSLLTGAPFFKKPPRRKMEHPVAIILFCLGILILLASRIWIDGKELRDFLSVSGLMLAFLSGCYVCMSEESWKQ